MDWQRVNTNWLVYAPLARDRWNLLSESDLEEIGGNRDKLVGYLHELYGYTKDSAETEADGWCHGLTDIATLVNAKIDSN
jgi:uncharacterized protein YjbJ (UPF0337 family)